MTTRSQYGAPKPHIITCAICAAHRAAVRPQTSPQTSPQATHFATNPQATINFRLAMTPTTSSCYVKVYQLQNQKYSVLDNFEVNIFTAFLSQEIFKF